MKEITHFIKENLSCQLEQDAENLRGSLPLGFSFTLDPPFCPGVPF